MQIFKRTRVGKVKDLVVEMLTLLRHAIVPWRVFKSSVWIRTKIINIFGIENES